MKSNPSFGNFSGFLPFPFMAPAWQQPAVPAAEEEPPVRVRVALAWLAACTNKTQGRLAVNDTSIEDFPGQSLSPEESDARAEAAEVVRQYLAGNLKLDRWERREFARSRFFGQPATVLNCPHCNGRTGDGSCNLCKGAGTVLAFPNVGGGRVG